MYCRVHMIVNMGRKMKLNGNKDENIYMARTLFKIINHTRLCNVSKKAGFIHSTQWYAFFVVLIKETKASCVHNFS